MKPLFTCLLFLFPLYLSAQSGLYGQQKELIGTRIDSLTITHYLLNEPADKNLNRKFRVLEFWATWCKPCLKAVPHLNKLQEKFSDSNIVFLSFTNEPPAVASKVFGRVDFKTITVSDTTATTHRQLRILAEGTMGLPRTVLIDDDNKIIWFGSPDKLKEKRLQKFLRREPVE